jgi:hypothetical protein
LEQQHFITKQYTINQALDYLNLIHRDRGKRILFTSFKESFGIEKSNLLEFRDSLLEQIDISPESYTSIYKLFSEKQISCKMLKIDNPFFLYSIMKHFFSDNFRFNRYPIVLIKTESEKNQSISLRKQINEFIKAKAAPINIEQVKNHFIKKIGFKESFLYNIIHELSGTEIIKFAPDGYVHLSLFFSRNLEKVFSKLLDASLFECRLRKRPWVNATELSEFLNEKLPLASNLFWTPTLTKEITNMFDKYHLLGTKREIIVETNNSSEINDFETLLKYILKVFFQGAERLKIFEKFLRKNDIISNTIPYNRRNQFKEIIIENKIIKLCLKN